MSEFSRQATEDERIAEYMKKLQDSHNISGATEIIEHLNTLISIDTLQPLSTEEKVAIIQQVKFSIEVDPAQRDNKEYLDLVKFILEQLTASKEKLQKPRVSVKQQENSKIKQLIGVLADLYTDTASIARIINDSGIRLSKINLNSTPMNNWNNVLQEAQKTGLLEVLLNEVEKEYGMNEDFQNARKMYNQSLVRGKSE